MVQVSATTRQVRDMIREMNNLDRDRKIGRLSDESLEALAVLCEQLLRTVKSEQRRRRRASIRAEEAAA